MWPWRRRWPDPKDTAWWDEGCPVTSTSRAAPAPQLSKGCVGARSSVGMQFHTVQVSNAEWKRNGWRGKERSERKEERREPAGYLEGLHSRESQTNDKRSGWTDTFAQPQKLLILAGEGEREKSRRQGLTQGRTKYTIRERAKEGKRGKMEDEKWNKQGEEPAEWPCW